MVILTVNTNVIHIYMKWMAADCCISFCGSCIAPTYQTKQNSKQYSLL